MEQVLPKIRPMLEKTMLEDWNTILLALVAFPPQGLWSNKPVSSLSDLKGLKMRVMTAPQAEWMKELGAVPVTVAWPEVYTALQRGTVEGVYTATYLVYSAKLYEVVKYRYLPGASSLAWWVVANKDAFEKLPIDVQQALRDAGKSMEEKAKRERPAVEFILKTDELQKAGAVFTSLPESDIATMTAKAIPIWESYAERAGPIAKEYLRIVARVQ